MALATRVAAPCQRPWPVGKGPAPKPCPRGRGSCCDDGQGASKDAGKHFPLATQDHLRVATTALRGQRTVGQPHRLGLARSNITPSAFPWRPGSDRGVLDVSPTIRLRQPRPRRTRPRLHPDEAVVQVDLRNLQNIPCSSEGAANPLLAQQRTRGTSRDTEDERPGEVEPLLPSPAPRVSSDSPPPRSQGPGRIPLQVPPTDPAFRLAKPQVGTHNSHNDQLGLRDNNCPHFWCSPALLGPSSVQGSSGHPGPRRHKAPAGEFPAGFQSSRVTARNPIVQFVGAADLPPTHVLRTRRSLEGPCARGQCTRPVFAKLGPVWPNSARSRANLAKLRCCPNPWPRWADTGPICPTWGRIRGELRAFGPNRPILRPQVVPK